MGQIRFSEGTLPSVIGNVNCTGDEAGLVYCHHVVSPPCDRFSDAGVFCQGKMMLLSLNFHNVKLSSLMQYRS